MKTIFTFVLIGILILSLLVLSAQQAGAQSNTLIFATLGDYGVNNEYEQAVASMVSSWNPELILGLGDNYYAEAGGTGSEKYDLSTGKYYCSFLKDITTTGTFCPTGQSSINRFFPALGDHDYDEGGRDNANLPSTYTDYFNLPGAGYTSSSNNERYYDFVSGPVHFFILNSIDEPGWEPDGATSSSVQAQWLQTQLGASTSIWNVVVIPNPPYSSGITHGSASHAQWPFAQWGADVVFSGDEHNYERIVRDGIVYFVNGLGGQWPYQFGTPVDGSAFRYNAKNGAQRVTVTDTSMTFEFFSADNGGTLQDTYTITAPHNTATPTLPSNSTGWLSPSGQSKVTAKAGDGNGYEVIPTNAYADDALFAMDMDSGSTDVLSCLDIGKDKHKFNNYNISIPGGSAAKGIQVRLDARADSIVGTPKLCVSLSWDGGTTWSDWETTPTITDVEQTYILGGVSDTWGHTWTTTELSNTSFQIRIADIASDNSRDFSLDWIAVNVVYSIGLTSTPSTTSTFTASPTYMPTDTPAATNTLTDTPALSTATSTFTAFPTDTSTTIATNPFTSTATGTSTSTNTATSTASNTPTSTPSSIAVPTDTQTYTPAITNTSAYTASPTPSNAPTSMQTSTSTPAFTNLSFSDVPIDYWAGNSIERLYKAGITGGCSSNPFKYCPETIVTRDQMAIFLERGMHGLTYTPPVVGGSTGFGDVLPDYWAGAWIKQLAAEGITGGCGSNNYCPKSSVTRAQMAVFLLRSKYGASYSPPAVEADTGFGDVSTTYWAGAWIKQLVAEGITAGCGSGNYCPEVPVTRAQMAVFLVRTFGLP